MTFSRYTESARRALFYARHAVSRHGGTSLGDLHLLLGLFEGAPLLILRLGYEREARRRELRRLLQECASARATSPNRVSSAVEVPLDEDARQILDAAAGLADTRGDREIGPERLLVALVRQRGEATMCLQAIGIDAGVVEALLAPPASPRESR